MIALRLDEDLENRFNQAVDADGKNRSQVIRDLIESYLENKNRSPGEVFKSKFTYLKGEEKNIGKNKPMSKTELKEKVKKAIAG